MSFLVTDRQLRAGLLDRPGDVALGALAIEPIEGSLIDPADELEWSRIESAPPPQTHTKAGLAVVVVLVALVAFFALNAGGRWQPSEAEVKQLLRRLPYRFEFRPVTPPDGASAAVAGKVIGPHRTVVNFGISFGNEGVPVPHAGTLNAAGGSTYVITDDTLIRGKHQRLESGKQFHTAAQWRESSKMMVDIEEALCKAQTGKPCPV